MHGFSSSFPHGGPGAGLLLLRCTVAVQLLGAAPQGLASLPGWQVLLLGVMVLLLLLGMLTPVAAALVMLYQLIVMTHVSIGSAPMLASSLLTAMALALLGPGAYAADARLFGRRRLLLPPDPAPSGTHNDYSIHLGEKK